MKLGICKKEIYLLNTIKISELENFLGSLFKFIKANKFRNILYPRFEFYFFYLTRKLLKKFI